MVPFLHLGLAAAYATHCAALQVAVRLHQQFSNSTVCVHLLGLRHVHCRFGCKHAGFRGNEFSVQHFEVAAASSGRAAEQWWMEGFPHAPLWLQSGGLCSSPPCSPIQVAALHSIVAPFNIYAQSCVVNQHLHAELCDYNQSVFMGLNS